MNHGVHEYTHKKPMVAVHTWSRPALSRALWYKQTIGFAECVFVVDFYAFQNLFGVVKQSPGHTDFFFIN